LSFSSITSRALAAERGSAAIAIAFISPSVAAWLLPVRAETQNLTRWLAAFPLPHPHGILISAVER